MINENRIYITEEETDSHDNTKVHLHSVYQSINIGIYEHNPHCLIHQDQLIAEILKTILKTGQRYPKQYYDAGRIKVLEEDRGIQPHEAFH